LFQTAYGYEYDVNQLHRSENLVKLKNSSTEVKNCKIEKQLHISENCKSEKQHHRSKKL
jgi:hypothetical protein